MATPVLHGTWKYLNKSHDIRYHQSLYQQIIWVTRGSCGCFIKWQKVHHSPTIKNKLSKSRLASKGFLRSKQTKTEHAPSLSTCIVSDLLWSLCSCVSISCCGARKLCFDGTTVAVTNLHSITRSYVIMWPYTRMITLSYSHTWPYNHIVIRYI